MRKEAKANPSQRKSKGKGKAKAKAKAKAKPPGKSVPQRTSGAEGDREKTKKNNQRKEC